MFNVYALYCMPSGHEVARSCFVMYIQYELYRVSMKSKSHTRNSCIFLFRIGGFSLRSDIFHLCSVPIRKTHGSWTCTMRRIKSALLQHWRLNGSSTEYISSIDDLSKIAPSQSSEHGGLVEFLSMRAAKCGLCSGRPHFLSGGQSRRGFPPHCMTGPVLRTD